jgi:hypothetical protein
MRHSSGEVNISTRAHRGTKLRKHKRKGNIEKETTDTRKRDIIFVTENSIHELKVEKGVKR